MDAILAHMAASDRYSIAALSPEPPP
jgi:hypothetical protein